MHPITLIERCGHRARSLRTLATLAAFASISLARVPTDAAETGRVGFYSLADVSQTGAPTVKRLVPYVSGLMQPYLAAELVPVNARGGTDAQIAQACDDGHVNAIVVSYYQDKSVVRGSQLHEIAEAHLDVFDCFGDIAYDGAGTAEAFVALADAGEGSYNEARIATDRAFAQLQAESRDRSALANLVRYGIALGNGVRTAGLQLRSSPRGAIASPLAFGTAARAGIRKDDLVTSLNGQSLLGLGDAELRNAIAAAEKAGGNYVAAVTRGDGEPVIYTFVSEDLAGYLHPPTPSPTSAPATM